MSVLAKGKMSRTVQDQSFVWPKGATIRGIEPNFAVNCRQTERNALEALDLMQNTRMKT
jgi:hypothetical protein